MAIVSGATKIHAAYRTQRKARALVGIAARGV